MDPEDRIRMLMEENARLRAQLGQAAPPEDSAAPYRGFAAGDPRFLTDIDLPVAKSPIQTMPYKEGMYGDGPAIQTGPYRPGMHGPGPYIQKMPGKTPKSSSKNLRKESDVRRY